MILNMFSVRDNAVGAYLPPFFCRAKGEALRMFTESVNDDKHQFAKFASDYTLVYLGTWDDASGVYSGVEPVRIISALEVRLDEEKAQATVIDRLRM